MGVIPSQQVSAPRVHGWFRWNQGRCSNERVCPACAWVVPSEFNSANAEWGLPRVCMGGSLDAVYEAMNSVSAPRVHGWFTYR